MPELTGYIHLCDSCDGKCYCDFAISNSCDIAVKDRWILVKNVQCPTCKVTGIWEASQ